LRSRHYANLDAAANRTPSSSSTFDRSQGSDDRNSHRKPDASIGAGSRISPCQHLAEFYSTGGGLQRNASHDGGSNAAISHNGSAISGL
jgi:hypothetical protein